MSTITSEAPELAAALPEWRRICHIYSYGTAGEPSACGTARWGLGDGHYPDECRARGHSVCVVCLELLDGEIP